MFLSMALLLVLMVFLGESLFCNKLGIKQVKTKTKMKSNKRFEANDSNITVQVAKITHIYAKSWQLKYNKVFNEKFSNIN